MVTSSMPGNDTSKVVKIIGDHKARILKISDLFIEGEISYKDFNRLRRDLGFRKVVYSVTNNKASSGNQPLFNQNFKAVGTNSPVENNNQGYREPEKGDMRVRFRVFK